MACSNGGQGLLLVHGYRWAKVEGMTLFPVDGAHYLPFFDPHFVALTVLELGFVD